MLTKKSMLNWTMGSLKTLFRQYDNLPVVHEDSKLEHLQLSCKAEEKFDEILSLISALILFSFKN